MKGLVIVRLWHRDIILKMSRDRLIDLMDHTQCGIAVALRLHNNSHCEKIIDLIQSLILGNHFLVNTEIMLCSAVDRRLDPCLFNMMADLINDLADQNVSLLLAIGNA